MRFDLTPFEQELKELLARFEESRFISTLPVKKRDQTVREMAESGDGDAQAYLAWLQMGGAYGSYARDVSTTPDLLSAATWARRSAKQNNLSGHAVLFLLLFRGGPGLEPVREEAVKSLRVLAEREWAEAQALLGECCYMGKGMPENNAEALKWFRLAIQNGCWRAGNNLADMYEYGHGVPENREEAVRLRMQAAKSSPAHPYASRHKIGDDGL
ncbi:MAG TPA: tetratricopeptide repeat protein [Candidatus Ozemobacteraceae bacterium]|nr:tetratricopeptide repeat protein [Candidatus Ozemobacteraceae bacterium]